MYSPKAFRETNPEVLHALIKAYPFAAVVLKTPEGLVANHLPFELATDGTLHGHVARGNELVAADGADVLLIFQAADGYISPNWYPTKKVTGREVPTWNYAVVHVYGRLKTVDDPVWLRAGLEKLTDRHEATQADPWHVSDAPEDHIQKSLCAIVGIEIAIEHMEGKFKLNQNHPAGNRAGVIEGLYQRDGKRDAELADLMLQAEARRSET